MKTSKTRRQQELAAAMSAKRAEAVRRKEAERRQDRRKRIQITAVMLIVLAIVGGMIAFYFKTQADRKTEETALANTQQVYTAQPAEPLVQTASGAYYSVEKWKKYPYRTVYRYSTLDVDGDLVESVITDDHADFRVRLIDPAAEGAAAEPRVVIEVCSLEPIDPDRPSYTGDPYKLSHQPVGQPAEAGWESSSIDDEKGDTGRDLAPFFGSLFGDDASREPLCTDQVTFYVPDGGIPVS